MAGCPVSRAGLPENRLPRSTSAGIITWQPDSAKRRANLALGRTPGSTPTSCCGVTSASGRAITWAMGDRFLGLTSSPSPSSPGTTSQRTRQTVTESLWARGAPPSAERNSSRAGDLWSTTPMILRNRFRLASTDRA